MTHVRLAPTEDGTYTLVVSGIPAAVVSEHRTPPAPERISDGQLRALHAKANDLDRREGQPLGAWKRQALLAASMKYGREITSALDLTSGEASWLLDWLEEELHNTAAP